VAEQQVVIFLGTSLTAGQGVEPEEAYPALVQQKIDTAGLPFRVVNAGVSGETSAAGLRRMDWLLKQRVDVLVLELGANDGLRGQDIEDMHTNLQAIVNQTRAAYPDADFVIAGMEAPPNLGSGYTQQFRDVFRNLASENSAALIPFLLDRVAAEPELNQMDGIHPNSEGHQIMAETVWEVLEPVLRGRGPIRDSQ
jgi:acyl-CoA thioesterase-1